MKMYHNCLSLVLVTSISFSSYAAEEGNQAQGGNPPQTLGEQCAAVWRETILPSIVLDTPLGRCLTYKSTGYIALGLWGTKKIYQYYTLPIDVEAMESRLLRLESLTSGMIEQRHANMNTIRSNKYAEDLWRLSDQLLELRSELSIPELKALDETMQRSMLDKIDSLLKRIDLMTKMKVAAVAA